MHERMPGTKRGILYFVGLCFVFMQAGLWSARRAAQEIFPDNPLVSKPKLLSLVRSSSRPSITQHPIPTLMANAESSFRNLLSSQSKTLAQAVDEYKRRYKRDPPKGFDDWWQYIQDNDVLMVDEYDAINEDLTPFWDLTPVEFRLRATLVRLARLLPSRRIVSLILQAGHLPSVDLVKVRDGNSTAVNIKDGYDNTGSVSARAKGFLLMIEKFQAKVRSDAIGRDNAANQSSSVTEHGLPH